MTQSGRREHAPDRILSCFMGDPRLENRIVFHTTGPTKTRFGSRQQLYLLFMLLGAFQLLTIAASLLASSRLERYYSRALVSAELRNDRRRTIASLEQLATETSMPPADELNSRNWEQAQAQLHYASEVFFRLADRFREELAASRDPADQAIRPKLTSLSDSMTAMLEQGDQAFAAHRAGDRRQFEAQMLYADRAHRRLLLAVGDVRHELFHADDEKWLIARGVRRWNIGLEAFATVLVAAVALYGRKLHGQMHADEAALRERRELLEQAVLERTTELRCEVAERKRIEAFRRSANQLLEMVAQYQPDEKILHFLARMVAEHRPGISIAIALTGDPPESFIYAGALRTIMTGPNTPMARAAREGRMICVEDAVATAPTFHAGAMGNIDVACAWWAAPILGEADCIAGTVSLVFPQLCTPVPADKELLATAARLAGLALGHRHIPDAPNSHPAGIT
jgi:hypothetical protein